MSSVLRRTVQLIIAYGIAVSCLNCGQPHHSIVRTMRPQETWLYTLEETLQVKEEQAYLKVEILNKVSEVKPDGSAIVERELRGDAETIRALQESMGMFGTLATRSRLRFTPKGEEEPLDGSATLLVSVPYAYPDKPVKVGDRWERTHTSGSLKARYQCQLVGIEKFEGAPCYKVQAEAQPLPNSLPQIEGEVSIYIDTESGWVRHIQGILTMSAGGFEGKLTLKVVGRPALPTEPEGKKP